VDFHNSIRLDGNPDDGLPGALVTDFAALATSQMYSESKSA
jgi:hypothetical protein